MKVEIRQECLECLSYDSHGQLAVFAEADLEK